MKLVLERTTINKALSDYNERLAQIPDNRFKVTPSSGGWSYAEVYAHILKTSIGITEAINQCVKKQLPASKKGLSIIGMLMLGFERFPPFKVKQPKEIGGRFIVDKISKLEAFTLLDKLKTNLNDLAEKVVAADPQYRFKHPRMGMLNAQQWYKFIRIHMLHHLKQLDRIDKDFSSVR
ncbi:DinB family protein [Mucilaginibacter flavus]|uniref:DinB family protein n=1 Tax=Mucilaginibacter flavus TaxID=931504 RepID=UPI0025B55812|nr:DinB family protein [Mucilaginibacter flavus]MDN3584660.1 DinB family protein [Mucilaginibacter flavus]